MSQPGERTMVPASSPQPSARTLGWAVRIVDSGPRLLGRIALASLAATSVLVIAIALCVRPAGTLPQPQREVIMAGLAGLALTAVLVMAAICWPAMKRLSLLDRIAGPEQRAAIWLASACWFPTLLIAAYYRARSVFPPSVVWIAFGFLDRRWITACCLLGVLLPMLLLVAAARVLSTGREHPQTWWAWLKALGDGSGDGAAVVAQDKAEAGDAATPHIGGSRDQPDGSLRAAWQSLAGARYIRVTAGMLTALGIAYYFYGPPWYLAKTAGQVGITTQEDVFLGGLQAMSKGDIPYIGPASLQYGPGAQLLSYLYMRHVGSFSVVGFRESWAMLEWAGASLLFVVFFLALGYARGLAAALLSALVYPALHQMEFLPGRAYVGYYGWANPLRYAGAISLVLLLPAVVRRCPARRGLIGAAVLGVLWGGISYIAQENLIAGAVGALAVAALLLLSNTSSWRPVLTALCSALAGFVLIWSPVLAFYAAKGLARRFVYLYFLDPRAVAEGYSNTPFGGVKPGPVQLAISDPWRAVFFALPALLAIVALLCVVRFRPFRIAERWTPERTTVVAITLTTMLMYHGALLRSDASHLTGTLLVFPALVIVVASALPRLLGACRQAPLAAAGAVIVAGSFLLLPYQSYAPSNVRDQLTAPYLDRQRLAADPDLSTPASAAGRRAGPGLAESPLCCQSHSFSMSSFLALMDHIHAIVGNRTTYVVNFYAGYQGLVYFMADLTPAPVPLDLATMVMTEPQHRAYMKTFRISVLPRTQALLTRSLGAQQARYFLARYRHARIIRLTYLGRPYYVVLSTG